MNPLYLMIPGALSCSMAFMLPVATPPNTIVFASGHIKAKDMVSFFFACVFGVYEFILKFKNTFIVKNDNLAYTSLQLQVKFELKSFKTILKTGKSKVHRGIQSLC